MEDSLTCYKNIKGRADEEKWNNEINALEENKTWKLTKLPPGKRIIDNKWVFRRKRNETDGEEILKARLAARGFTQELQEGI